jgi:predicted nucleic acid-binding Zn ribbon protein
MASSSLRNKAIAEWRGYAEPRPLMERVQPMSSVLNQAMQGLGLKDLVRETEVLQAWKEIVGEFFALHSAPSRLRDGVLHVRVLQPAVHFELERVWKSQILEKLKARFGTRVVRELRFRVG